MSYAHDHLSGLKFAPEVRSLHYQLGNTLLTIVKPACPDQTGTVTRDYLLAFCTLILAHLAFMPAEILALVAALSFPFFVEAERFAIEDWPLTSCSSSLLKLSTCSRIATARLS